MFKIATTKIIIKISFKTEFYVSLWLFKVDHHH
jgi:hypothetical protein